jgi:hypothetical protein
LHSKLELDSVELKPKLAAVEVVLDVGPLEIDVFGGVVSGGGGVGAGSDVGAGVSAGTGAGLYSWWRLNRRRLTR